MRTIASIRERIFAPLERAGAQVDVFFHTYTLAKVSSAWAREVDAVVGGPVQELKLLDEGKHRVVEWSATNQQLFDKKTNYTAAYYALHGRRGGGDSQPELRNVVRAMNSLKLVTELWMATASTHVRHAHGGDIPLQKAAVESGWYSHVVYARPDLRYITPLDVALLRNLSDNELYTPEWDCWTGFNAVWNQILTRRRGLRMVRSSNRWLISTGTTTRNRASRRSPRAGHRPRPHSACAWTSCRELPSCRSRTGSTRGVSPRRV